MKLQTKLIFTLGTAAAAALIINFGVSVFGVKHALSESAKHLDKVQNEFVRISTREKAVADAAVISMRINEIFSIMDRIYHTADLEQENIKLFEKTKPGFIDFAFFYSAGKCRMIVNPYRKSDNPGLKESDFERFTMLMKRNIAQKECSIFPSPSMYGCLRLVFSRKEDTDRFLVFSLNMPELLKETVSENANSFTMVSSTNGELAGLSIGSVPQNVISTLADESIRTAFHAGQQFFEIRDSSGKNTLDNWACTTQELQTRSETPLQLRLYKAMPIPQDIRMELSEIRDLSSASYSLLILGLILAVIIFAPFLLITGRKLSALVDEAGAYAKNMFRTSENPEKLRMIYSEEFISLADSLNFLRDKLDSALIRLSRSKERENQVRKDAENSNILRARLLSELIREIKYPLSMIAGFNEVVRKESESGSRSREASEKIQDEIRALQEVRQAFTNLSLLDSLDGDFSLEETDPSRILRETAAALTQEASARNIAIETTCSLRNKELFFSTPLILEHLLETAGRAVLKFAAEHTTIRLACTSADDKIIFACSDTKTEGAISIAAILNEYLASGTLKTRGCAAALLNLLVVKNEAAFLNAEMVCTGTEKANSVIAFQFSIQEVSELARTVTAQHFAEGFAGDQMQVEHHKLVQKKGKPFEILLAGVPEQDAALLRMVLDPAKFLISTASLPCDDLLKNRKFDIVAVDLSAEKTGNFTPIARMHELIPAASILFALTNELTADFRKKAHSAGADACFEKPLTPDVFMPVIQKFMV